MNPFFIANVTVKDPHKFQEYAAKAAASMKAFGGRPLVKGKVIDRLAGDTKHPIAVVVSFPDTSAITSWYHSEEYQSIIPLRNEAADMNITSYESL